MALSSMGAEEKVVGGEKLEGVGGAAPLGPQIWYSLAPIKARSLGGWITEVVGLLEEGVGGGGQ